jgi:hypothetical protein
MSKVDLYPTSKSSPSLAQVQTGTTFTGDKVAADVNVLNNIDVQFSGLNIAMKITTMEVTDVAGKIPATPLAQRNAIAVTNLDAVETIYVGPSTVTAGRSLGTTAGWEIGPSETFNVDITENIELWAVADTGATVKVKVLELA